MKILITNDDGISSPVLMLLADALSREHKVMVVAPSTDQSGMSQAFTHGTEKRLSHRLEFKEPYPAYQIAGTPCDCIKFAVAHLFEPKEIDLIISGINLGENAGMSAVYSGTVAAAREGAMWGIPALAVSVWKNASDHLEAAVQWLLKLLRHPELLPKRSEVLGIPGQLWNINFPACDPKLVAGAELTTMSTVMFKDSYEEMRTEHGLTQFRLIGYKPPELFREGTDDFALTQNRIAITPLQVDQTAPGEARRLAAIGRDWNAL